MLELRPSHLDSTSYCFTSTLYSHSGSIPNPQRKGKSSKKSLFFVFLPSQLPPIIDVISSPTWWLHFRGVAAQPRREKSDLKTFAGTRVEIVHACPLPITFKFRITKKQQIQCNISDTKNKTKISLNIWFFSFADASIEESVDERLVTADSLTTACHGRYLLDNSLPTIF